VRARQIDINSPSEAELIDWRTSPTSRCPASLRGIRCRIISKFYSRTWRFSKTIC